MDGTNRNLECVIAWIHVSVGVCKPVATGESNIHGASPYPSIARLHVPTRSRPNETSFRLETFMGLVDLDPPAVGMRWRHNPEPRNGFLGPIHGYPVPESPQQVR